MKFLSERIGEASRWYFRLCHAAMESKDHRKIPSFSQSLMCRKFFSIIDRKTLFQFLRNGRKSSDRSVIESIVLSVIYSECNKISRFAFYICAKTACFPHTKNGITFPVPIILSTGWTLANGRSIGDFSTIVFSFAFFMLSFETHDLLQLRR